MTAADGRYALFCWPRTPPDVSLAESLSGVGSRAPASQPKS
uniref:Uncharacterized protein n=1 Tax=Anopheles albimanus TaxID=7167 RepID=A0A182FXP9_ANOAL